MKLSTRWQLGLFVLGAAVIMVSVSLLPIRWAAGIVAATWLIISALGGRDWC